MTLESTIKKLSEKLDSTAPALALMDKYWSGTQPAAFLAPESAKALGNRLRTLSVNFPRLACTSLAERLTIAGFTSEDDSADRVWAAWARNGMADASAQAHLDALIYGRSFVAVWADAAGRAQVTVESPLNTAVLFDPVTRAVTAALKRWEDDEQGHAVLYLPDTIHRLSAPGHAAGAYPSTGWRVIESIDNPFGMVPIIPIVNRGRLAELDGVSEMADVIDLADALNKIMSDAMVTSEYFARPRRWATGLELSEDDDGNVINPFAEGPDRVWMSEDPATKFGQFDAARLDGYADLSAVVTQQIGALTGLPPHYLGLHGDQPASADAIRSAEASLVSRAYALQRTFGLAWAQVASLIIAAETGREPTEILIDVSWANPETRTPAQAADAAVKLRSIGVPLTVVLAQSLGYSPEQIQEVRAESRADALDQSVADVTARAQLAADLQKNQGMSQPAALAAAGLFAAASETRNDA